jgi:ABC-type sugar transport system substrate-binding protein
VRVQILKAQNASATAVAIIVLAIARGLDANSINYHETVHELLKDELSCQK